MAMTERESRNFHSPTPYSFRMATAAATPHHPIGSHEIRGHVAHQQCLFGPAAEGVLPVLVMNSVLSVTLLKNMVRSLLQMVGAASSINSEEDPDGFSPEVLVPRERRISITQFKSLCHNRARTSTDTNGEADFDDTTSTSTSSSTCCSGSSGSTSSGSACTECCVCLCGFEAEEEVSELSCKHFFHKGCLDKWFDNNIHTTCPLCRSID